jgi:hypothetical protein
LCFDTSTGDVRMDYRPLFGDLSASPSADANAILASGQRYPTPTSLQIFAIVIIFVFPAVALVTVIIRAAGRIAIRQFGWGMSQVRKSEQMLADC